MARKKKDEETVEVLTDFEKFKQKHAGAIIDIREIAREGGFFSTGSIKIDKLLNGGFPRGRMVEIFGPPHGGKTTIALATAAHALRQGRKVAYFDLERGLDIVNESMNVEALVENAKNTDDAEYKSFRKSWLRTNGIDPFSEDLMLFDPTHGEEMFEILEDIIVGKFFDVVVVDSVAAIVTRAELEGNIGESHYGQVAKLLSASLKRLMRQYRNNRDTIIIWINQIRDRITHTGGAGWKSTGGNALEHYVGTRLRVQPTGGPKEAGGEIRVETRVKVIKSRYAPSREEYVTISSERGLDTTAEVLEYAVEAGYAHKAGNWFYLYAQPVDFTALKKAGKEKDEENGFLGAFNGETAAKNFMDETNLTMALFEEAARI